MDPVTLIVLALAAGAAAGLKPTAEQAVKDAYAGVKALIQRKYSSVRLDDLEKKPESKPKQDSTAEDLADAGAGKDDELLEHAKALLDAVKEHDRQAAQAVGVDLENIEAQYLTIQKVRATGTGVRLHKGIIHGGIDIGTVDAGAQGDSPKA